MSNSIDKPRVAIIGLGYVGLPLIVTAASRGYPTIGLDVDVKKIDQDAKVVDWKPESSSSSWGFRSASSRFVGAIFGAQAEDAVSTLEACPLCQRSRRQRVLVAALYKRANSRNSVKGQLCNIKRTFTVSSAVA